MSKAQVRILNEYRVILNPEHPRAMINENWNGYVYEHIVVAELYLGRSLKDNEIVHHLDGNRSNNRHENLLVLERSQHSKLEEWLRKGAPSSKVEEMNRVNSGKSKVTNSRFCCSCGKTLQDKQKICCSVECYAMPRRKVERPNKECLEKEISEMSFCALGRKYGVSDNAVRKWARAYRLL